MKKCSKCKISKSLNEFHTDKSRYDGLNYWCKSCTLKRCKSYRDKNIEALRINHRKRWLIEKDKRSKQRSEFAKNNREHKNKQWKKYYNANPEKFIARTKLNQAVNSGKIIRPCKCSECGNKCTPVAHHPDYLKPLDVQWLCTACHGLHNRKS